MIIVNQLKLPVGHTWEDLQKKTARTLHLPENRILSIQIARRSLDARKKPDLKYIYTLQVTVSGKEETVAARAKNPNVVTRGEEKYRFPGPGKEALRSRPVIIGCGPAGLFCGLMLAKAGYCPILLERGEEVETRRAQVEQYWNGGPLLPESNVQFGEGGAGTFSDGKLNTLVKDPCGRNKKVLEIFAEAGADASILYESKPHIGTDVLGRVVRCIRQQICDQGGEVRFHTKAADLSFENGSVTGVFTEDTRPDSKKGRQFLPAGIVILAVGHSARDTFEMLAAKPVSMEAKAFAVGVRVQHPQKQINLSQYGLGDPGKLGAASYKLTRQTGNGRGVYSFCMCPGGFVVDASSEPGRLAVNGMSYSKRDGENANSAIIVTVTPEDFPDQTVLAGMAFQRRLEEAAFLCGNGKIPVQLYGDYKENKLGSGFGGVNPAFNGQFEFGNLREIFPKDLNQSLIEGMEGFGRVIDGFDRPDAILAGVESRTSSPLRILRDKGLESSIKGLYPCGEGAGYAGGITSAAMDGLRVAEEIGARYLPLKTPLL